MLYHIAPCVHIFCPLVKNGAIVFRLGSVSLDLKRELAFAYSLCHKYVYGS